MMDYVYRRSVIHNLHPLTKLVWSVLILVLALIFDSPWYLSGIILSVILVGCIGKVAKETLIYTGGLLAFSTIIFLLQVFFRTGGRTLFSIFPPSLPVVGGWLPVTVGGILYGVAMSLRVLCIVTPFSVILSTTQPRDVIMALVDKLHVPYDYAFLFTTTLRFIPIITTEVSTISQAQRSRAYAVEGWNPIRRLKALAPIAMPIVFIAIEKAERLGLCMDLRGYGSKERTYLRAFKLRFLDWALLILMTLVLIGAFVALRFGHGRIVIPN
jgi:energy-coupling factor transport system permease protein